MHVFSHLLVHSIRRESKGDVDVGNVELVAADSLEKKEPRGWYIATSIG